MKDRVEKILREPRYIVLLELSIVLMFGILLWVSNIHLFSISSSDIASILGTILQSSVTIIAILFSLLLFVGESYLGKYVSSSIKYVINNPPSLSLLCLYVIQILSNIIAIIYNNVIFIDISIILFFFCILLLLPYYLYMNKLFNPRRLIDEAIKAHDYNTVDDVEIIRLIYQIILNLVKNNETVDAIYGIKKIVSIGTRIEEENKFNAVCIEYLERIAVESFSYDPVITNAVIGSYGELLNHISTKIPNIVGNSSSYLASSCYKINKLTGDHLYSERSLMLSFDLYNRVYVSQSLAGYGWMAFTGFQHIYGVIELMKNLEMEDYKISGGFAVGGSLRKMLKKDKYTDAQKYMEYYIEILDLIPTAVYDLIYSILQDFSIDKKKIGVNLLKKIKEKRGDIKITLVKSEDPNTTRFGGGNEQNEIRVETTNQEIIERVGWFDSVFNP